MKDTFPLEIPVRPTGNSQFQCRPGLCRSFLRSLCSNHLGGMACAENCETTNVADLAQLQAHDVTSVQTFTSFTSFTAFEDVWWEPSDGKQKLQVINQGKRSAADLSAPPSSSKQLAPRTGRLWPHSFCTANLLQLPKMHSILGRPQGLAPGGQEWEEICEVLRDHAGVVSESQRVRQRKRDRERESSVFLALAHCIA